MSERNDGGPAFPTDGFQLSAEGFSQRQGMSLRDWFAGQALTAVIASGSIGNIQDVYNGIRAGGNEAKVAYAFADAMLAAREAK